MVLVHTKLLCPLKQVLNALQNRDNNTALLLQQSHALDSFLLAPRSLSTRKRPLIDKPVKGKYCLKVPIRLEDDHRILWRHVAELKHHLGFILLEFQLLRAHSRLEL